MERKSISVFNGAQPDSTSAPQDHLNEIDRSIMLLYLEEKSYDEIAEIIGFLIGLFVSYLVVSKIRKYKIKNLEYLKELHAHLCKE
jgi:DNA-directed RNA polymerase specialized sigma subunit